MYIECKCAFSVLMFVVTMHHQLQQLMSSPLSADSTLSQMAQLKDRIQKMEVSYDYAQVLYS